MFLDYCSVNNFKYKQLNLLQRINKIRRLDTANTKTGRGRRILKCNLVMTMLADSTCFKRVRIVVLYMKLAVKLYLTLCGTNRIGLLMAVFILTDLNILLHVRIVILGRSLVLIVDVQYGCYMCILCSVGR